jgi:acyl carrier protein
MEIERFIELVKESFDELETPITPSTEYKKIEEWTSMQALILIAHLDDSIGVVLSADDLKNTSTMEDLYKVVVAKMG